MAEPYKTVASSHAAFAAGTDLVLYRDWRHVADLLLDDDTRAASSVAVANHAIVALAMSTASGMIEAAAYRGGRYSRADLQRMLVSVTDDDGTGVTVAAALLKHLTCELAFYILLKRRKPDINPRMVAGVPEALGLLESLRLGEAIFPFIETTEAGVMDIAPLDGSDKTTYVYENISETAYRMFGVRGRSLRS